MAAPAAAPLPQGILMIRGEESQHFAEVCSDSQLLSYHRVPGLLLDNAALGQGLAIPRAEIDVPTIQRASHLIKMPETALLTIHILLALDEAAASNADIGQLDVSFLDYKQVCDWFDPAKHSARAALLGVAGSPAVAFHALSLRARKIATQRPLPQFQAEAGRKSKVRFRFCGTLAQAVHGTSATRVVYLPNLMWFQRQAERTLLLQSLEQLLHGIQWAQQLPAAPRLYPPHSWDELLELKDQVYKRHHDIMIKTNWLPLQHNTEQGWANLADRLVHRQPAGTYVLKGNYSDAGDAVRCDIQLDGLPRPPGVSAAPQKLIDEIGMLATKEHQTMFGLQLQKPELRFNEFRHYCFAEAGADGNPRFRLMVAVRTHAWEREDLQERQGNHTYNYRLGSAHISIPSDAASIACHDLVLEILMSAKYQQLRDQLLSIGCSALRIDCGYDAQAKRAYLCELTSPASAGMFHFAHETELVWMFGRLAAQGLMQSLA